MIPIGALNLSLPYPLVVLLNRCSQPFDGNLLGFGFDLHRQVQVVPAVREIPDADKVVMAARLRSTPTFERAGDVEQWLPIPSRTGLVRGLLNAQPIRVAAMVMNVVDQRNTHGCAERDQVSWTVAFLVVFQGQSLPHSVRQQVEPLAKLFQGGLLVAIRSTGVDVDYVGSDPLSNFRLIFKLGDGMFYHIRLGRIQNNELVRVKRCPQTVCSGKVSTSAEMIDDLPTAWEVVQIVADIGMGLERKDLAVDAKAADAMAQAELQGLQQGFGVFPANARQLGKPLSATELLYRRSGRCAELDRLVSEYAAQPQANHLSCLAHDWVQRLAGFGTADQKVRSQRNGLLGLPPPAPDIPNDADCGDQRHGFWAMAHESRTDFSMILGSIFLLIVGAGSLSLDALIARSRRKPT